MSRTGGRSLTAVNRANIASQSRSWLCSGDPGGEAWSPLEATLPVPGGALLRVGSAGDAGLPPALFRETGEYLAQGLDPHAVCNGTLLEISTAPCDDPSALLRLATHLFSQARFPNASLSLQHYPCWARCSRHTARPWSRYTLFDCEEELAQAPLFARVPPGGVVGDD